MKNITISIVDDDKIYHYITKKIITSFGLNINIQQFFNGEEALDHLKSNLNDAIELPDTIFLDINMPIVDGWEFLNCFDQFKLQLPKPIIIYMVSSSNSDTDIAKANSYESISGYLVKPITKDCFYNLICKMVA